MFIQGSSSNIRTHNLAVIALKLIIAYGLIDVFGFVHNPLKGVIDKRVNVVLGFVYTSVRSMSRMKCVCVVQAMVCIEIRI